MALLRTSAATAAGGWKPALAKLLCTPPVGKAIGGLTRDRIPNRGLIFDTRRPEFTPSLKAAMFFGIYESAEIRLARRYLAGARCVVELGASLGVTSAHVLRVLDPAGLLICVEANPALMGTLRQTVESARRSDSQQVRVVHGMVGGRDPGSQAIPLAIGASTLESRSAAEGRGGSGIAMVPAVSLAELVAGLPEYSLVIDVEGAEAALLEREADALRGAGRIVVEVHDSVYRGREMSTAEMADVLIGELGLRLLARRGSVLALGR